MVIELTGKNKMGFVEGTVKRSTSSVSLAKAWDRVKCSDGLVTLS